MIDHAEVVQGRELLRTPVVRQQPREGIVTNILTFPVRRSRRQTPTDLNDLSRRMDKLVDALDGQRSEIEVFREKMQMLKHEMSSLDQSVASYRRAVARIPHAALGRQMQQLKETVGRDHA